MKDNWNQCERECEVPSVGPSNTGKHLQVCGLNSRLVCTVITLLDLIKLHASWSTPQTVNWFNTAASILLLESISIFYFH